MRAWRRRPGIACASYRFLPVARLRAFYRQAHRDALPTPLEANLQRRRLPRRHPLNRIIINSPTKSPDSFHHWSNPLDRCRHIRINIVFDSLREDEMTMAQRCVEDAGRIAALAAAIRSGALTATALLERYLARIDAVEPSLQAWRLVARDNARAEAASLDRDAAAGRFRGPLHGIPVGIKDIIDVAGLTTLANSRSRAAIAPASADAEIVAALRLAGAVILGKTHTTQFGFFDPSPARQPHYTDHTPRRSSSRSGACAAGCHGTLAVRS